LVPSRRQALALLIGSILAGAAFGEEPWRIEPTGRIVAVSDIHGAYDAFDAMLQRTGIVDAQGHWIGGSTNLVIVGDVLDRGPAAPRALDLIMSLQEQAQVHGGGVHFVLGNHEVMNIVGDLRYVPAAEFAEFASQEPAEIRTRAFQHYLENESPQSSPEDAQTAFDSRYPPGYFGQREAFSSSGKYGAWLLEQPLVLIAGDTAFAHGGISRAYGDSPPERINQDLKQQLRDYVAALETAIATGILSPADDFYDHAAFIEAFEARVAAGAATWPAGAEAAAQKIKELNDGPLFALASPTWYRGMVSCSPLVERDHWETVLQHFGVARLVLGHTPTPDARVLSRMGGGILRIDTGMLASYYGGQAAALIIDGDEVSALHAQDQGAIAPIAQPRRVGNRPARLTDDELESLLRDAEITARAQVDDRTRLTLRRGELSMEADFYPAERAAIRPEVAAYRLDRLLGLAMVPVTVPRELDGEPGSLQFVPSGLITEAQRSELGTGGASWCPLRDQYPAMYVFDALIFNEGRGPAQIAYTPESFDLLLLGHTQTFSTQRGRPRYLETVPLVLNDAWRTALSPLDQDRLTAELGDVLSSRQIRALARRIADLMQE